MHIHVAILCREMQSGTDGRTHGDNNSAADLRPIELKTLYREKKKNVLPISTLQRKIYAQPYINNQTKFIQFS